LSVNGAASDGRRDRISDADAIRALPHFVVAIDGPSGAGKSTIAKAAAGALGIDYIDTGAMYRAVALKILRNGIALPEGGAGLGADADSDAGSGAGGAALSLALAPLNAMLSETVVDLDGGSTLLDGEDVSGLIRTPEVTMMASKCSALPVVRAKLVALQRDMGAKKSVIMDGRDIGSNVFPNARFKFFITASPQVRAGRRHLEMLGKGVDARYADVLADIEKRDFNDSHRAVNPLVKTDDAIEIFTDDMGIEEVLACVIARMSPSPQGSPALGETF
jgi:cytidylate kinase